MVDSGLELLIGDPVIYNSNSDTNPFRCTSVTLPNANLIKSLLTRRKKFLSNREGFYQCCLPNSCSDPNTNIITANIFSKLEQQYSYIILLVYDNRMGRYC